MKMAIRRTLQGTAVATESLGCVITGGTKGLGFALAQVHVVIISCGSIIRLRHQTHCLPSSSGTSTRPLQHAAVVMPPLYVRSWLLVAIML